MRKHLPEIAAVVVILVSGSYFYHLIYDRVRVVYNTGGIKEMCVVPVKADVSEVHLIRIPSEIGDQWKELASPGENETTYPLPGNAPLKSFSVQHEQGGIFRISRVLTKNGVNIPLCPPGFEILDGAYSFSTNADDSSIGSVALKVEGGKLHLGSI